MKPIKVYLTDEALAAIDEARGNRSRSEFVGSAALDMASGKPEKVNAHIRAALRSIGYDPMPDGTPLHRTDIVDAAATLAACVSEMPFTLERIGRENRELADELRLLRAAKGNA